MEEILRALEEIKPGFDFEGYTNLADDGILDSFDIIQLVSELDRVLDIDIPVEAIIPENFNSLEAIEKLIKIQLED